ncbi:RAD10 [Candida oxycetoniae]|uniref:RAD10 n=1 Tax=Candida oxycetoniae TaxID=497107 RepID=A0AAI9T1U2_9ASCO|nr:RAD10 [Candida oxycetoniae]KAI3407038.2 RAD10 [Candida oxycetoniae]
MSDNGYESKGMDSSSFASILAGVKRMREEYGGDHSHNDITIQPKQKSNSVVQTTTTEAHVQPLPSLQVRNQLVDVTVPRTTLEKPTAKPVPPHLQNQPSSSKTIASTTTTNTTTRSTSSNDAGSIRQLQQHTHSTGPTEVLVHKSQEKNPLLVESMMKTTPWVFDSSILSDYYISATFQILFLSLKYHKLRPEYIWTRLKKLNKGSSSTVVARNDKVLRVLLVVVDIDSHQEALRKLSDFCIKHDLSLVLAWSFEEAGNYIALGKHFDSVPQKSKQSIRGFKGTDYNSSVVEAFTTVKSINKTDVSNLLANCKSVKSIVLQSCGNDNEELGNIAGLGSVKRENLKKVFSQPFIFNKNYDK